MRSLNREFRAEIPQRSFWQVQPATKIPGIAKPDLVNEIGVGRPSVADVQILLTPVKFLDGPGNVPVWLSGGGIQGRHGIGSGGIKVASAQPWVAGWILVLFEDKFVGVIRAGRRSLPAGCAYVGHWNRRKSDCRICGI